jgi:hypothetical protein
MFCTQQEERQQGRRQVKLRASCDGCGVAKVKCDRKHPKCGRCDAYGTICVYGISRKIGKPAKKRIRSCGDDDDDDVRNSTGSGSSLNVDNSLVSCAWDGVDGILNPIDDFWDVTKDNSHYSTHSRNHNQNRNSETKQDNQNDVITSFDVDVFLRDTYNNPPGSSMPNFSSLGFDNWKDRGMLPVTPVEVSARPVLPCELATESQPDGPQSKAGGSSPSSMKGHDCYREAHDLLWRSSTATGRGTDLMAWDHLLLLNREASEQLLCLLGCSCPGSPYLMMLYASLVYAILARYQHATGDPLSALSNHLSPQSTPGTSEADGSTIRTVPSTRHIIAEAKVVVGVFSVDDHRVQSALKIQLLASEMRRTAQLLDRFAAYDFHGRKSAGISSGNDISNLHQSLNIWLQGEYSKTSHVIRTKVMELST